MQNSHRQTNPFANECTIKILQILIGQSWSPVIFVLIKFNKFSRACFSEVQKMLLYLCFYISRQLPYHLLIHSFNIYPSNLFCDEHLPGSVTGTSVTSLVPHCNVQGMCSHPQVTDGKTEGETGHGRPRTHGDQWQSWNTSPVLLLPGSCVLNQL